MKKYENIIEDFLNNQNNTQDISQRNVYSKQEYRKLLDQVLKILKKNKDADINEIRQKLYENSGIELLLRDFFLKNKKAPGAVISFGVNNYQEKFVIGNSQEIAEKNGNLVYSPLEMKEDAIFDLASCTKLFTSVAILQLAGNGEIRLDDNIKKYLPQFKNLGNNTVFDLLTFEPYYTEKRIDSATDICEAERYLFEAKPKSIYESYGKDRYNDIAPMILKYIVEEVTGMNFYQYVYNNILVPGKMNNTFVKVPESSFDKIVNCNFDYRLLPDGKIIVRDYIYKGISSDTKAISLGQPSGYLSGHAGIFSTSDDMVSFGKGLMNGTILHPALTNEMAKNRTGNASSLLPYYGFLCTSKHPNKYISDMHQGLSGNSLSMSGWTGTYFCIDPTNKINLTFLSNRVHNRLTSVSENQKYRLIGKDNKHLDYNGNQIIDASLYGFERRKITEAYLSLAIQEKMLEDIVGEQEKSSKLRLIK